VNDNELRLVFAATAVIFFIVANVFMFAFVRLWIQALLTKTPVSLGEIIRMRLVGCPPELIVRAMIALSQRGVKVSANEMMNCYLAARMRDEPVATATELAELMEEIKRDESPHDVS
jgi:uncharacterized protein YqfA (UPF0365 family)